jgi:hypothetical protein
MSRMCLSLDAILYYIILYYILLRINVFEDLVHHPDDNVSETAILSFLRFLGPLETANFSHRISN